MAGWLLAEVASNREPAAQVGRRQRRSGGCSMPSREAMPPRRGKQQAACLAGSGSRAGVAACVRHRGRDSDSSAHGIDRGHEHCPMLAHAGLCCRAAGNRIGCPGWPARFLCPGNSARPDGVSEPPPHGHHAMATMPWPVSHSPMASLSYAAAAPDHQARTRRTASPQVEHSPSTLRQQQERLIERLIQGFLSAFLSCQTFLPPVPCHPGAHRLICLIALPPARSACPSSLAPNRLA